MATFEQADAPRFDPSLRYVRRTGIRDAFVEFEFAVGDPDLSLSRIVRLAAFRELCPAHGIIPPSPLERSSVGSTTALGPVRPKFQQYRAALT